MLTRRQSLFLSLALRGWTACVYPFSIMIQCWSDIVYIYLYCRHMKSVFKCHYVCLHLHLMIYLSQWIITITFTNSISRWIVNGSNYFGQICGCPPLCEAQWWPRSQPYDPGRAVCDGWIQRCRLLLWSEWRI